MSIYASAHTCQANGEYTVSMSDPNNNGGIANIFNSSSIPFHIETTFYLDGAIPDNSPFMLELPIDKGIVGEPFTHISNAFDADGDSLSFTQIIPLQATGSQVPVYYFSEEIVPGPNNQAFLEFETGEILWSAPQAGGSYTIAILIRSYRNGVLLNSIIRDLQIDIFEEDLSSELTTFRKVRYLVSGLTTGIEQVDPSISEITLYPNPVGFGTDIKLDNTVLPKLVYTFIVK